ncbi:fungal-specific transcription factor domain-containing protein [Parachaetomium inaequale]|uniref:Fungal-specific transcription factor domain-containing protein n=1 Tax=Parachaetomium inaequale TaxID=2588326 RepID=A0AAN6PCR0_9PEZI|nr:fungal-specific transcription factor domain-containing protein [Parachaetomium inaequale]
MLGSSLADSPLLKVSRPVSACSRCRSAKVKCDNKLPACTACERAGREKECTAANDQFARGKERSYVAALELRIEKLERRLIYARSTNASVALHGPDEPPAADPSRKDSLAFIRAAIHRKAARTQENADINTLVSDFGYLAVNTTTRDFEPSESNMTFARLVLAASTNEPVPEPRTTNLPAESTARALVQFYETSILPLYPAFPGTSLHALVSDLYQEHPRQIRSSEYWLFWLVLAIGSAAQSRSRQDEHYLNAVEFVARALPHADRALKPGYVTQVQSLLLLTQYSMLDPTHFDSWHPIGFTCRAVVDQGLHQDPPHVQQMDQDALAARRRTFYCVYALDRAISMVHARAFSFYDDAVSVALPSPGQASSTLAGGTMAKPSPDASVPLFRLRQLQSDWYQTLYQGNPTEPLLDATSFIWQKYFEMWEWSERLPTDMPAAIREMLDLELRYSYVYCIASSARGAQVSAYGRLLIFDHAISYIDRIYDVANLAANAAFYTYHDALRVFFMGSQFVAVLRDVGDLLLSGSSIPVTPSAPGKVSPPPRPVRLDRGTGDNLDRSLRCLERVKLTLRLYGDRWEDALSLMDSFEMISAEVWKNLTTRQAMRNAAAAG